MELNRQGCSRFESPGHFLFTAPRQACSWLDGMTGLPSISLGHDAYAHELAAHGLVFGWK
jgi:hypothetical protein